MPTPNIDNEIIRSIAYDTDTPVDTVSIMFAETWAEYSDGAKIMDYLSVLVARRVRENISRSRQEMH